MDIKTHLDNYLGKNSRYTEKNTGNGFTEVCDLNSGECYTVRERDGLIERVDNTMKTNRSFILPFKVIFKIVIELILRQLS